MLPLRYIWQKELGVSHEINVDPMHRVRREARGDAFEFLFGKTNGATCDSGAELVNNLYFQFPAFDLPAATALHARSPCRVGRINL